MDLTGPPALLRLDGSIIIPHMLPGKQAIPSGLFCISVDRSSRRSHGGRKLVAPHITDMNRRAAVQFSRYVGKSSITPSHTLRGEKIEKLGLIFQKNLKNFSNDSDSSLNAKKPSLLLVEIDWAHAQITILNLKEAVPNGFFTETSPYRAADAIYHPSPSHL